MDALAIAILAIEFPLGALAVMLGLMGVAFPPFGRVLKRAADALVRIIVDGTSWTVPS